MRACSLANVVKRPSGPNRPIPARFDVVDPRIKRNTYDQVKTVALQCKKMSRTPTPPTIAVDQSYARVSDGSTTWQVTNAPSIDTSNRPSQESPTPVSTSTNQGQGSSGGVDSNGNSNSTPTLITGTQPAWSKLQLPTPCFSGAGDCLAHVNTQCLLAFIFPANFFPLRNLHGMICV